MRQKILNAVRYWRSRVKWWIRWLIYASAVVAAFYWVENFRGARALADTQASYLSGGATLDLEEAKGPVLPEERNFYHAPLFANFHDFEERAADFVDIHRDVQFDPDRFARGFHYPGESFPALYIEETPLENDRSIALAFLKRVEPMSAELDDLVANADQWSEYRCPDPSERERTFISTNLIRLLQTRSLAHLELENIDRALADFIALGQINDLRQPNAGVISSTIQVAHRAVRYGILWEMLRRQSLSLDQLRRIERHLSEQPTAVDIVDHGVRINIAEAHQAIKEARGNRIKSLGSEFGQYISLPIQIPPFPEFDGASLYLLLAPDGWFSQNMAASISGKIAGQPAVYSFIADAVAIVPMGVLKKARKTDVLQALALMAVRAEIHFLETGAYPTANQTDLPTLEYGVQLDSENNRPVFFYDTQSVSQPISEVEFGSFEYSHPWRYPPPNWTPPD